MNLAGGIQESEHGKRIQLVRFLTAVTGFRLEFIPHLMRGRNDGILSIVVGLRPFVKSPLPPFK